MSPRSSTFLALMGVLLAGIPLPALTAARRESPAPEATASAPASQPTRLAYATLHCSGQPLRLRLLHEGRELARLSAAELAEGWSGEVDLPMDGPAFLVVEAAWPEGGGRQAITLVLEPEGLPAQPRTLWTDEGENTLHGTFPFSW